MKNRGGESDTESEINKRGGGKHRRVRENYKRMGEQNWVGERERENWWPRK